MNRIGPLVLALVLFAATAAAQDAPPPQDPPPAPAGGSLPGGPPPSSPDRVLVPREEMWRAPTEEDWRKPCLLVFQRTWEDALAVARETRHPILVCVNMDGEIASEHYAGVRYREPAIAALYEPYVKVIASVYRHSTRDHDDEGRRVPCPRFGSVTCGEHIAIEPILFEKFFDGRRIAPRHVMVEVDGKETFDVFYANDTASIFSTIRDGIEKRAEAPPPVVRGDRPVVERVASRDVVDRQAVEGAFREGDGAARRALLEAAARNPDAAPIELHRLALFGVDPALAALARQGLAKAESPAAVGLIAEALRAPLDPAEREALLLALARIGRSSPRARWVSAVHRGLGGRPSAVDAGRWGASEYPASGDQEPSVASGVATATEPAEAAAQVALAEAVLDRALEERASPGLETRSSRMSAGLLLEDARAAAERAEALGGANWRSRTVAALAAYYSGDKERSYALSERAVKEIPPGESGHNAWAVLTVYAEGRWKAIQGAMRAKREWDPQWLTDLHAACSVLDRHPLGTDAQVVWHHELLDWLGTAEQAIRVLEDGLGRFPDSEAIHERLRLRLLEKRAEDGLEGWYAARLEGPSARGGLRFFAARASLAAGDSHRRSGRATAARAAYARAEKAFDVVAVREPARRDACDRSVAFLHAGRARLCLQANDLPGALEAILASFGRMPSAAGDRDGLGITPGETGQMLRARLKAAGQDDLAKRLDSALASLDQELLRPDRE